MKIANARMNPAENDTAQCCTGKLGWGFGQNEIGAARSARPRAVALAMSEQNNARSEAGKKTHPPTTQPKHRENKIMNVHKRVQAQGL